MGDISYGPEGSLWGSISSVAHGVWDEIASTPGNIVDHYKRNTGTALLETLIPPLLIIDADVRAEQMKNDPLTESEAAVDKMVEDSVLKGNTSQLHDLLLMHAGDPHAIDRIMNQAQTDLAQFGVKMTYQVDSSGKGQLRVQTDSSYVTMSTDGTQPTGCGDIKNGKDVPSTNKNSNAADSYLRKIASDAQQYTQKRFQR